MSKDFFQEPVLYETHSHTPLCKHAFGAPTEYAAAAEVRGLRGLTITCHNPMPDGFSSNVRMGPEQFEEYLDLVDETRIEWAGRIDVRLGLEADYFQGYESWVERQLASADFHYVLGSVHPQLQEFRERYGHVNDLELQRTYFRLLADAAETGLYDSLAHPDLIKNVSPESWDPGHIMDDIRRALDRISATGIAMELNTSGAKKRIPEMNPFPEMLNEMNARGIPVVIGADAHTPTRVADLFKEALSLMKQCGYTHVSQFLNRSRMDIPISTALSSLAVSRNYLTPQPTH